MLAALLLLSTIPVATQVDADPAGVSLGDAHGYLDVVGESAVGSISEIIETLQARTRRTARSKSLVDSIRANDRAALTDFASGVVRASDLVDVVAIFNADGDLLAFNDVDWTGKPFTDEQRDPLLALSFEGREIVMGCVRNESDREVLEFQTTCDFTPALFGSTGLSVALTTPVVDAAGKKLGAVSTRLRFDRIIDRMHLGAFEAEDNRVWFVSDRGAYFDEGVNGGSTAPPFPQTELEQLLGVFESGSQSTLSIERANRAFSLYDVPGLETVEGGGIFVLLDASQTWVADLAAADRRLTLYVKRGLIVFLALSVLLAGALFIVQRSRLDLAAARQSADMASRSKSSFLASTSHEIRTPMAAILGYADFLADDSVDVDDELRREAVESIQVNGAHLMMLIGDVLDLAKIEAGSVDLEPLDFEPRVLVQDAISLMRPKAAKLGTALTLTVDPSVPRLVRADPTRVRQVVLNLLSNAIKFTREGEVSLQVHFDERRLELTVADGGIGMKESALESIFDPFAQAEESTTRKFGGTGLGLPISRQLCQLMNGDLRVESEYGVGSTFTATFAVEEAAASPNPEPPSLVPTHAPEAAAARLEGSRILVVDDTSTNLRLLTLMLAKDGADVTGAEHGGEAVAACEAAAEPFDLILMDAQMPVMNGSEALRELRDRGILTPIVVLTADALAESRGKYKADGFDDFASKPITRKELSRLAAHWVAEGRRPDWSPQACVRPHS